MSLLPDTASFHEQVEACFVAYRGRGLSLSAHDLELVDAWAAADVPVEVVARGLRRAAEGTLWDAAQGEGRLRSLRSARRQVESEISKYLKRAAGKTANAPAAPPFEQLRQRKLVATLKRLARRHRPLAAVAQRLAALPPPADFRAADRREALALVLLTRALPFSERTALLREARALVLNAPAMSPQARLESLRFHRAALVRHRWQVPAFW